MIDFAEHPDELGHRLVELGLAPNVAILDMNGALTADDVGKDAPWNLPSRMMRFPIAFGSPSYDEDGKPVDRCLSLMHPQLSAHPFVTKIEKLLSRKIGFEAASKIKYRHNYAQWWHAVDLISSGHFDELIETRRFTTNENLLAAVSYGLRYGPKKDAANPGTGHVTVKQAHAIADLVGVRLAAGSDTKLDDFLDKAPPSNGQINLDHSLQVVDQIAILIAGIERGAFRYRAGYLRWTHCIESQQMVLL